MGGQKYFINEFPTWQQYKVSDSDTPDARRLQRMLASHGLRDPWLRNHLWRFSIKEANWAPFGRATFALMTKGMPQGIALGLGLAIATKIYYSTLEDRHDHH